MQIANAPDEDRVAFDAGKFKTEDAFRLMVDSVVDYAIFMLDPQGRIVNWNRGAERIKHYTAEEIIGEHFTVFYPPEALESGLPEHELTMARQDGRYEDEGWRIRKGGSRFWANVVITALHDETGQLFGFGKVTRDLSECRRAEQGLATAYDQVNSVLECVSDGVVKIDKDWAISYGNYNAVANVPDLAIGKNYWDCFPDVRGTALEPALLKAMEGRSEEAYEYFYAPYQKWYRGKVFPTDDGLSVFFTDVTEEKALQKEVERGRYLKEKRIEALAHMAGGLAHEINNPLAIIQATATDLLQLSSTMPAIPSVRVRTACETIVKTSDRAIKILHGLKGFGREADKDPMETASIYEIVDQCIELQGLRFERHKVALSVELEPDLPYIECREVQIGQIITNLLNNAFDAIVQGQADARWVTLKASQEGAWLHVDVSDSGPGIAADVRTHLMEPFFTTKEIGLGMGIGLSLSRAISLEHGGTLTLRSDQSHTCFRLALPIVTDPSPVDHGQEDCETL